MSTVQFYLIGILEKEVEGDKDGMAMMYLASFVVVQLKEDFTGYKIDPEELIRTKITDYDLKKDFLEMCKEEALKQSANKN